MLRINPNTWPELSRLLDAALDLPASEREQWLAALGQQYDALKPQIRELLSLAPQVETNDFLERLPEISADLSSSAASGAEGEIVGPYSLVRELGTGGMGSVWLAQRTDGLINRPVALKLPHGMWRRAGLAERMARERAILATLDHPNIARLYDAGLTSEGQPYLALEYVEGSPIDAYCREKQLDLKTRLELFAQAASAVAYAHGKLVIHRDLKPANILVTAEGEVRLLDFGIAKLIEAGEAKETLLTELSGRAMTPDYASPEQIRGEPLTVASDVYSLGVLLYELLTGQRPYKLRRDSHRALEEAILQADPMKPSEAATDTSRKALRGDLDNIVCKALKKAPEQRYATVHALLDDIERYLNGRPVLARPDSRWYRTRKFVARNRLAVAAATSVLMAVLIGAGVATWQARVALDERDRAEEVKELLTTVFRQADPYAQGRVPTAIDLLAQAERRIDLIDPRRSDVRVELMTLVGESLLGLQDTNAAERLLRRAVSEAEEHLPTTHPAAIRARLQMLTVYRFRGQTTEMRAEIEKLSKLLQTSNGMRPEHLHILLRDRAHLELDSGAYEQARVAGLEAAALAEKIFGPEDERTISTLQVVALAYLSEDRPADALPPAERAFRAAEHLHADNSMHPLVINTRSTYARALAANGSLEQAIAHLERARSDAAAVLGPQSEMVGFFAQNLVRLQLQAGRVAAAVASAEQSLAITATHAQRRSFTYAAGLNARANAQLAARRPELALPDFDAALDIGAEVMGGTHEKLVLTRLRRIQTLVLLGRFAEAEQALAELPDTAAQSALRLQTTALLLYQSGHPAAALEAQAKYIEALQEPGHDEREVVTANVDLGLIHLSLGQTRAAAALLRQARQDMQRLQMLESPAYADSALGLGRELLERGDARAALTLLQETDEFWRKLDAENRASGEASLWLSRAYRDLGNNKQASEALSRARSILSRSPLPSDAALLRLTSRH